MTVTTKIVNPSDTEYTSEQNWAENTKGVFMNMLNGVSFNTVDNKYHMMPIKYSDVNLTGEKIKFANGQEYTVVFSCLASEYAHKQEVKDAWWNAAKDLIEGYKNAQKIEDHIATNNVDLKKLRSEGSLLNMDELN